MALIPLRVFLLLFLISGCDQSEVTDIYAGDKFLIGSWAGYMSSSNGKETKTFPVSMSFDTKGLFLLKHRQTMGDGQVGQDGAEGVFEDDLKNKSIALDFDNGSIGGINLAKQTHKFNYTIKGNNNNLIMNHEALAFELNRILSENRVPGILDGSWVCNQAELDETLLLNLTSSEFWMVKKNTDKTSALWLGTIGEPQKSTLSKYTHHELKVVETSPALSIQVTITASYLTEKAQSPQQFQLNFLGATQNDKVSFQCVREQDQEQEGESK